MLIAMVSALVGAIWRDVIILELDVLFSWSWMYNDESCQAWYRGVVIMLSHVCQPE